MSHTTSTILVAEEHDATRAFLAYNLAADGYRVLLAPDRAKALALAEHVAPGPDPGRRQRRDALAASTRSAPARVSPAASTRTSPLIVLSRDADRLQRIRVLERGGDDVVRKPFAYPELRARIAAVLRRSELRR